MSRPLTRPAWRRWARASVPVCAAGRYDCVRARRTNGRRPRQPQQVAEGMTATHRPTRHRILNSLSTIHPRVRMRSATPAPRRSRRKKIRCRRRAPASPGRTPQTPIPNTATGHTDQVNAVAFSPDGKTLASGSWDGTVKLWDVASGQNSRTLSAGFTRVYSVAYSPDGKTLAAGGAVPFPVGTDLWKTPLLPGEVRLFDVASGKSSATFPTDCIVLAVAFQPGRHKPGFLFIRRHAAGPRPSWTRRRLPATSCSCGTWRAAGRWPRVRQPGVPAPSIPWPSARSATLWPFRPTSSSRSSCGTWPTAAIPKPSRTATGSIP